MTPVFAALGQEPLGGFKEPAELDEDVAEDEAAGAFDEALTPADFDGVAPVRADVPDEPEVAGAELLAPVVPLAALVAGPLGVAVPAPLVCDGSTPADSGDAACEPHPLTAASVKSAITTAALVDGFRFTGRTYHRGRLLCIKTLLCLCFTFRWPTGLPAVDTWSRRKSCAL
ncbi:hypothetical protein GCM10009839_22160 [Catenulispora yoronensis]|uniref:Uncharacterized protein n=1 Tax=Catenulispora yoronensis TaxID=450799 RepID=A0ABN2TZ14_9ACTN